MSMLPDLVKTENQNRNVPIKQVSTISTVCELFNSNSFAKSMFNEVHKLLLIYLTVPMTSATAERSFSALRRLKSYITLLHTHKSKTDELNLLSIAKLFVNSNSRRQSFFGNYNYINPFSPTIFTFIPTPMINFKYKSNCLSNTKCQTITRL